MEGTRGDARLLRRRGRTGLDHGGLRIRVAATVGRGPAQAAQALVGPAELTDVVLTHVVYVSPEAAPAPLDLPAALRIEGAQAARHKRGGLCGEGSLV